MKTFLAGEEVHLLAERCLYWPRAALLALSDLHLGKAESLQAQGIPLPSGAHQDDLKVLAEAIEKTRAQRIFILGDFIHSRQSWSDHLHRDLGRFFIDHDDLDFHLLLGNHEKGSLPQLRSLPLTLHDHDLFEGPFRFCHGHDQGFDQSQTEYFQIQGHVHPAVMLRMGSTRLRLPCFVETRQSLTLPSFGTLTGGFEVLPDKENKIFAVGSGEVFPVPS